MRKTLLALLGTGLGLVSCTVADGDPAFWTPSHGLDPSQLAPAGASGQAGQSGAAGSVSFGGAGAVGGDGGAGGGAQGGTTSTGGGGATPGGGGTTPGGGGAGGGGGGVGGGVSSGACTMHFEVTTVTYHGKYSPKNIDAIWVQNAQGAFVKSLTVLAAKRIANLIKWKASSGGNKVDAVTGATQPSPGTRTADWNCTDVNGNPVPDGPYKLMVEFTEEDSSQFIWPPGPSFGIDFTKSGAPATINPPDQPYLKAMALTIQ